MFKKLSMIAACFGMLFATLAARADEKNERTVITFSQPVELPGIVLPAGTYVFKLVDLTGSKNVVQVFNAEENKVFTTILAIPHAHFKPHEKTYIGFEERRAGTPEAIHEWFYPGRETGLEFVYPKARAVQLARESGQPVLAAETKPAETPAALKEEIVVAVTPENREIPVASTFEPEAALPLRASASPPAIAGELPHTASPLPFLALTGLLCLLAAGAVRIVAGNKG